MDEIKVEFLRKRDYQLVRELGQGACGKTVLLYDDLIDEHFVCKKYCPENIDSRPTLFNNFIREIKLLHQVHHPNVVRIFNYYLYPDQYTGYILMEFVNGIDIEEYIRANPDKIDDIFLQTIKGFCYLESNKILHRDIRPQNLMITNNGAVKIIDLGFGKHIVKQEDFGKSISLNWWCEPPKEFGQSLYDFKTELYFVGKLFENTILQNNLDFFQHKDLLNKMCQHDGINRIQSFHDVEKVINSKKFFQVQFDQSEKLQYQMFAATLQAHITKIEKGAKYVDDLNLIQTQLEEIYRSLMLEDTAPDCSRILHCFLNGIYFYKPTGFSVSCLKEFTYLLKSSPLEKKRIILANLHTRLDAVPRYYEQGPEDDIPF